MRIILIKKNPSIKKFIQQFFIALVVLSIFIQSTSPALAQSISDLDRQLKEKQDEIKKVEKQLQETKNQEKSLKSQLDFIDNQNKLTELKVQETQFQIIKLDKEINDLGSRITRLSATVDSMSEILLHRIVTTYKYSNFSGLDLLFSSRGFTDLLERVKYLEVVQANDKKVLYQLQATKATYNDQREDKQTRQTQQEKLKNDLEKYQVQLEEQKKAKQELLRATQNDEEKYQALINRLRGEMASITQAISNISAKIGPVNKGDVIARMGSTGCSTGPHLHFEVFENAKVEGGKIVGNRVNPNNYLGNGKLGKPLLGYPDETVITTEYGGQYNLHGFSTFFHTGLDIAPKKYEGSGRAIMAAESGIAYTTSAPCSYKIPGGTSLGKGVIVDHQNGLVTLYWHIL